MDYMGGILTKGLGGPACCGLIIAQFNLAKCCQYTVTVTPAQYDGGSLPLAPGQIQNFYSPVNPDGTSSNKLTPLPYLTPVAAPREIEKISITLKVKDRDEPLLREYFVPKYKSKVLINITRFVASSFGIVSVTTSNLKTKTENRIRVFAEKLRKR
jgi:hypothetical protein